MFNLVKRHKSVYWFKEHDIISLHKAGTEYYMVNIEILLEFCLRSDIENRIFVRLFYYYKNDIKTIPQ